MKIRHAASAAALAVALAVLGAPALASPGSEALDRVAVDFVPEGGAPCATSGLLRTSSDFVVLASRMRAELRLHRATSDVGVVFRGVHPDSAHWSNHLRMPTGLRVALRHVGLGVEVAAGVTAEGACFFAGRGAIPGHEEYELSVERGPLRFEPRRGGEGGGFS